MCGRFSLTKTEIQLEERFDASFYTEDVKRWMPNYNASPTNGMPVITNLDTKHIRLFHWGLIPSWSKDPKMSFSTINARVETLEERATFKGLLETQRCIVPADGYYEWKTEGKKKIPYRIEMKDKSVFAMAGLWAKWKSPEGVLVQSFTVITHPASEPMRTLHERMPTMLPLSAERKWLDSKLTTNDLLELVKPIDFDALNIYRVSDKVSSAHNNFPELLEPFSPEEPTQLSLF